MIIKNGIYLLCKSITEDQTVGDEIVKHKEISEAIVEYEVSCLGSKAESCLPEPGITFEDIKDQGSTHLKRIILGPGDLILVEKNDQI